MSETERNSPPADAQAELSERDRAEVDRAAERANLEAAILRFNTNYNPSGGPPQGRDLPRLNSPPNRRLGNPPCCAPGLQEGVRPRVKLKEEAMLKHSMAPFNSSLLDKGKELGVWRMGEQIVHTSTPTQTQTLRNPSTVYSTL